MERVPLVIVLFVAGLLVLLQTPVSVAIGLLTAGIGVIVLRRTAEWDPEYFRVLYHRLKSGRYHGPVPLDMQRKEYSFWQL